MSRLGWIAALLLSLCLAPHAHAQSSGRLLFFNSVTGEVQPAGIDVGGYLHTATPLTFPNLKGSSIFASTANGLLIYNLSTGGGALATIDGLGYLTVGNTPFSSGWQIIDGFGSYLLFYDLGHTGAIVSVAPGGGLSQTQTITNFSTWSQITATDNYLFFYEYGTGAYAVGEISAASGKFIQSSGGTGIPTGYQIIAPIGDQLLLYNGNTGDYEIGGIYFTGNAKDFFDKRSSGTLATGYKIAAQTGNHVVLYTPATEAFFVGLLNQNGTLTQTQKGTTAGGWTSVVSAGSYIVFYAASTGVAEIYNFNTAGQLAFVSTSTIATGFSYVKVTRN